MPFIKFGDWAPDAAFYHQQALKTAKGVIPVSGGYRPMPSFNAETTALSERVRGGILARDGEGGLTTIVGTASGLYKFDAASNSWTDISDATYSTDGPDTFWSMAQFGNVVLMTNMVDGLREYNTVTSPATVSVTAGSPPIARHVIVVKDHVVLCGLKSEENKIHWSAINDRTGWTVGVNLSDVQEFPDGGRILAAHGGEYGYIFQERKIRMMIQAPGAPEIFQFEVVDDNRGCAAPRASVAVGGAIFFLANDGFHVLAGNTVKPIADERVNRWFFDNAASEYIYRTVAGFDARNKLVIWGFISNQASAADIENFVCDRIIYYHWPTGKWAYSDERVTTFIDANLGKMSLEMLDVYGDLDSLPSSLDSAVYNTDQTASILRVFDENHRMGQLNGANQEAVFEVVNLQFAQPDRSLLRGVMPIIDAQSVEVAVAARERMGDTESYGSYVAIGANGWSPQHSSGRIHSVKVRVPAGTDWTQAVGFHVDAVPDGEL